MTFLSPLFLLGAAAAAVPIVLHFLKRHAEQRVRFAAVMFLKAAPVEHTSRRRLRQWLLLALRVAALVLLALAFARPFFRSARAGAASGTTVVAIDTSFSMSAPGRFDRAKAMAKDAIRNAASGDDVAVVTFSDQAAAVVRPTPDRGAALAAIDAGETGFGSTRYRAGLNAAGSLLARPGRTIVVVTDLQESGWDAGDHAAVPEGTRVEVRDVGALPENLAITGLRFDSGRAIATIRYTGSRSRQVRARLTVGGKQAAETSVTVEANASADAVFPASRATSALDGDVAKVTIDDPGGIQADNARYALLTGATRPAVLVATTAGDLARDAFYVQQALLAGPAENKPEVAGVSVATLSTWTADQVARHAVVVLLSTRGLEPRGRETLASYVAAGGGLLVAAGPDVDGNVVSDVLGPDARLQVVPGEETVATLALAPADVRHPIFRAFGAEVASLGLVRFHRTARIRGSNCQTLAMFTSGEAALIDCAAGDGHALVVASDVNNQWNDFPIRSSFVPFVHEATRYLSASSARAGEYLVGDVPPGVPAVPGVFTAPSARPGGAAKKIVVNVDSRESDPARITADEFQAAVTQLKDAGAVEARAGVIEQEAAQHLWQFLLALMIATLVIEGVVAARSA
jgi:hypothetical protein